MGKLAGLDCNGIPCGHEITRKCEKEIERMVNEVDTSKFLVLKMNNGESKTMETLMEKLVESGDYEYLPDRKGVTRIVEKHEDDKEEFNRLMKSNFVPYWDGNLG